MQPKGIRKKNRVGPQVIVRPLLLRRWVASWLVLRNMANVLPLIARVELTCTVNSLKSPVPVLCGVHNILEHFPRAREFVGKRVECVLRLLPKRVLLENVLGSADRRQRLLEMLAMLISYVNHRARHLFRRCYCLLYTLTLPTIYPV